MTEDKARKVLESVDFLSRLREDVAGLSDLRCRLESLAEPALDLPEWWIPGKHDTDLVIGAARYKTNIFTNYAHSFWKKFIIFPVTRINQNQI